MATLLLFIFRERNRLRQQGKELVLQRDQSIELSRKLEEATKAKLAFFTNVSHDFRTPLTLIADPVNQLREEGRFEGHEKYLLDMIHKNVTLLLRLVNQILDFRKYENGKLTVKLSSFNLAEAVRGWAETFIPLSYRKHVRFSIDIGKETDIMVSSDAEKLERIVYNLLSNAFKFTPETGDITLKLSMDGNVMALKVSDTGIGMSAEHIRHIFENFYQADIHHAGSGIGLALVKAFVELLGGAIRVESAEGKGSVFTVEIPVTADERTCDNQTRENAAKMTILRDGAVADADQETVRSSSDITLSGDRETILVIDDNKDVRDYIRSLLEDKYNVLEAADGKDGIRLAMKHVPDAVICDVMMPVMDGMECCRRLKNEIQTSHIPVMMLTAYAVDEQKIKGYECGADSYISKPFSAKLLKVRLQNLLDNRKRLKDFFGDKASIRTSSVSDTDKGFAEKLKSLIEDNLSNPEFSVESLGESIGMSRVQLYRKTKVLTGYSPVELLRVARLKRAASILSSSDRTVSEAAYMSGFNSPSYFAKCYREYFGENPTDLLKRKK